jgi:hypothetical protein
MGKTSCVGGIDTAFTFGFTHPMQVRCETMVETSEVVIEFDWEAYLYVKVEKEPISKR